LDTAESLGRRVQDARVEERRVRLDVVEQESGESRELSESADLLLHDWGGGTYALLRPVEPLPTHIARETSCVLVRREGAEIDAVHPVELRVVERRRARADSVEREALDQLVLRHDRGLAVRRPPKQLEEVHQRLREVAICP